jgi:hypothetical protein
MRRADLACACLLLIASATAVAALPASLQARFGRLPAHLQDELRSRDALWSRLSPAARQQLLRRLAAWDALPAPERRARRERWQAWKAMPKDQRLQVQAAALAFAALPPDRQQSLRAEFAAQDLGDQHGWLLGPALGAQFAALQPLLLQVPPEQRAPLLVALHAMTPIERLDLAVLAQRTAPPQRDALRRALLSTATTNRAAWLQAELAR